MTGIEPIHSFAWLLTNPCKATSLTTVIFNTFFNSGLPGGTFVGDVYAVAALTLESGKLLTIIVKNRVNKRLGIHVHAEDNLLRALTKVLSPGDFISQIQIWINFSPCWKCSEKLRRFFREKKTFANLTFPHLYKIKDKRNVEGLIKLKIESGLSVFDEREWSRLASTLGLSHTSVSQTRQDQDKFNDWRLQMILRGATGMIEV